MGAIFGAAVDVARHAVGRHREPFERFWSEALLERLLERLHAEDAARPRAGHRDADVGPALRDEHADERKTRGGIAEFLVSGLAHFRKLHLGDDLVVLERGLEQTLEEFIGMDAP